MSGSNIDQETVIEWHKVAELDELANDRIKTVTAGVKSVCLVHYQGRPVYSVSGDGGFGQYLADFTTAVKYNMNITHVLLNNGELGKISKEQMAGQWAVWQTSLHNPSFAEYAKLCGGKGIRVTDKESLAAALEDAANYAGPSLVEIITDVQLV
jgi:pyruvate oxidase